ncbi:MAG: CdvA-like protein [Candidatus Bathyarchaeota archaeon]|nr:MAG: CdvA-like protein [Candidatus Bathyarchaeota archaeon]
MSQLSPKPFLFIGKPVRDEYGRQIGRIASFMVKPNGRIDGVFIEHGDGEFIRYPNDQFRINGDSIVILPSIKLKVKSLCNEIPLIWRKDQALSTLSKKKGFPSDLFNVLHENFDGALNQLKKDAQDTLDLIDQKTEKCDQQIKDLHAALINLEIARVIGRLNDTAYQTAMGIIQQALKQANEEKTDLESMRKELSNLILGESSEETPATTAQEEEKEEEAPPDSQLPEPPVVVDVKPAS